MNLPDYFIADLPPEAAVNPALIGEACQTLKRNRERYLAHRSTHSLVHLLSELAKSWLNPEFPFRKLALEKGSGSTGFSSATLASGLDGFFKTLTPHAFETLLNQDLGHAHRLDKMTASEHEQKANRAALATGPELLAHIAAGNLPSPAFMSIILGVLARSAQFVKCASGAALLPRLLAHSIYDADPKLGACIEIAEWRGGDAQCEQALFAEADCVIATGSDQTLEDIRRRVPPKTRLLGYGHRVSFAYVAHEAVTGWNARKLAARAALDVAAWDQLGCLSPHVIYVQEGGASTPEKFGELLAEEMAEREAVEPRGQPPAEAAAAIASRRAIYELRAANSPGTRVWSSKGATAWTVVYEADPRFQLSCLYRFIYVKPVAGVSEALQHADAFRGRVSTVGLASPEQRVHELATELARWGVTRVCPLGQMQQPPLAWRHDGRLALADLVVWSDWEQG
ncbi:MAG TPA: acyl-CoA reductase [Verrucomicrobiae bacterium]|nr:acyl-CoA reductase [Verrucomicrobiae bacterium]